MAAAVLTSISSAFPKPSSTLHRARNHCPISLVSGSPRRRSEPLLASRVDLSQSFLSKRCFLVNPISLERRMPRVFPVTAHEEANQSDIEVEKENKPQIKTNESEEAWKQTLETFQEEARKMKEISQEAYEVYSKKAIVVLKETSEALKIQADKARHDLGIIAKEISEGGQVYLSAAAENSPEPVKDIVETFASSPNELKDVSAVRDFYLGIPYGAFLATGGFLNFMLTGSISAIRFGIILGSALLALSISSLKSWKNGQPALIFVKGQAAIAAVIFFREWRLHSWMRSFPTLLMTLLSGAMLAFYAYRIIIDESREGPSLDKSSDK